MNKDDQSAEDRSIKIDGDAARNVFITGDHTVLNVDGRTDTVRGQRVSRTPVFPAVYREWLLRQCADIDVVGLRLKDPRAVKLNQVYVPLTTPARHEAQPPALLEPREALQRESKSEMLLNRLNDESLYVSGAPGSGKSTFCRWLTWVVCMDAVTAHHGEEPDEFHEHVSEELCAHLPILVRLRDFWNSLPTGAGEELSRAQLERSLELWFGDRQPGGLSWGSVQPHLEQGKALIIFDGVDEVPISHGDRDSVWYPRKLLLSGLSDAVVAWTAKGNRLLVTSRPYGLNEAERQSLGLPEARIDNLPRPLQHLLAQRWFRILTDDVAEGDALANDMFAKIQQRRGIDALTSNPMLLTAMCVIYREGKRLPQDKCDLYGRIVENVLYNRVRDPARIEMVRNELRVVAHGMHTGHAVGQPRTTPEAEVDCREIDEALEAYRQKSRWTQAGFEGTVASREYLLSQSGLLLPRSDERAAFYHLSIQEFLAAERFSGLPDPELAELFRKRAEFPEWYNTLSFLFGSIQNVSVDRSVQLVETLLDGIDPDQLGLQVVVGDALQMLIAKNIRLQPEREEAFRELCLKAIQREESLRERNLLGLALGHLGDPRIVTDLRELSAYVEIPKGNYAYQDDRQTIDETFLLSKYPVTSSQFATFIADNGYENRGLWSEQGWKWKESEKVSEPRLWRYTEWNGRNQPVVGVSFYEAEAFCKWAGGFLPTEQQWEAAARGPDGLEYPWDNRWEDGICNSVEEGLDTTSPVGLFPRSRSRDFGLDDLSGNVWEWCDSWYDQDRDSRVLRGGSFLSYAGLLRSSCRLDADPVDRYGDVGFRVARTYP